MKNVKDWGSFVSQINENESGKEIKIDKDIEKRLEEFYKLQTDIEEATKNLKEMQSKFSEFSNAIDPMLSSMKEVDQRMTKAEGYIIKVKAFGGSKSNFSYKSAFEESLSKVNGKIKSILLETLETTKTVSKVKNRFKIDKLEEASMVSKIKDSLKSISSKFKDKIRSYFFSLDKDIDALQRLSRG